MAKETQENHALDLLDLDALDEAELNAALQATLSEDHNSDIPGKVEEIRNLVEKTVDLPVGYGDRESSFV